MTAAYLITFREGLEAALIVGILLATMRALGAQKQNIFVWGGVIAGILLSLVFAYGFQFLAGGFEGKVEKIYEGLLMLGAAGLITHLIFWISKQGKTIEKNLKEKVAQHLSRGALWSIAFLSMMSVVREGVETVIFFQALSVQADGAISYWSAIGGVLTAIGLALLIFKSTKKISLKSFFTFTKYLLIFIAAGLVAHGIVELQGAGWLPAFIKPLFDLSAVLPETQGLGALLKAGFGYDANPSLIAVIGYLLYLGTMLRLQKQK